MMKKKKKLNKRMHQYSRMNFLKPIFGLVVRVRVCVCSPVENIRIQILLIAKIVCAISLDLLLLKYEFIRISRSSRFNRNVYRRKQ